VEFGLGKAGTTLAFDNLQLFDTTAGPAPPVGAPAPSSGSGSGGAVLAATSEAFGGPGAPVFSLAAFEGAGATVDFAGGAAKVTVTKPSSTQRFHLQLKGPSVPLSAAKAYTLTATVSASPPASIEVLWLQETPIAPVSPKAVTVGPAATVTLANVKPAATGPHHVQVLREAGGCIGGDAGAALRAVLEQAQACLAPTPAAQGPAPPAGS
jgi:hypothetical protein